MSSLSIILRSLLVFVGLAILFVPLTFLNTSSMPTSEAENTAALEETQIAALSGLNITDDISDSNAIFQREMYAYLADESALAGAGYSSRPKNDTANRLVVANDLAKQKQFDKALIILQNAEKAAQNTYDVQFLRARILSWAAYHNEAEQIFKGLLQEYPSDTDVVVAYAYLKFYRQQLYEAENLFTQVVAKHPNYLEAQTGLDRTRELIRAR